VNIGFMGIAALKRCFDRGCTRDVYRTKQVLQNKYQNLYMGPQFTIANKYSALIALTLIVLTYTTSMPIMYFAAFIICLLAYWTDKFLFLRYYKNPPQYTKEIIMGAIQIMELGVVLHLVFGLFMITNK
jgi:hypothetical protein